MKLIRIKEMSTGRIVGVRFLLSLSLSNGGGGVANNEDEVLVYFCFYNSNSG